MSTEFKKHRVLLDLKIAMTNSHCGIAKENRLVFKMFTQLPAYQVSGLLVSNSPATVFARYQTPVSAAAAIEQTNRFFHEAFHDKPLLKARLLSNLHLARLFALRKKAFNLYAVDPLFNEAIWRKIFDGALNPKDKNVLQNSDFLFTDLTSVHMGVNAYMKRNVNLDTQDYDFAFFLEPTPVTVSPTTQKIVRYYDAIPLVAPDFSSSLFSYAAMNTLNLCAQDAYFVCISEPTREVLLKIHPQLESKTAVIPCALSDNYKKVNNEETLRHIMATRLSAAVVDSSLLGRLRQQILQGPAFEYIFNLATLDPKKNHLQLIRAWEKLNYQRSQPIKLVLGANRGWLSAETKALMSAHVEKGDLIHLEHLAVDDLLYLFSHATAFVFPSYVEGFGLPPLEAMQCHCATIVADIPSHRWVMGEAALFCDPYDSESIKEAMAKLVYHPGAQDLRESLIRKGLERVKLYAETTLNAQWLDLLEKIKKDKRTP